MSVNGSHSIITLAVVVFVVIFVAKLIIRRVGRPVTKVYNTVTPVTYVQPPMVMPPQQPPVYRIVDGYAGIPAHAPQELPSYKQPMTEDEAFEDIVRNYDKP